VKPKLKERLSRNAKRFREKALYIATSPWRIFKLLCFMVGLVVILLSAAGGIYVHRFLGSLPDLERMEYDQFKSLAVKAVVRRSQDQARARHHAWVDLARVNRDYLYTIVMSEDSSFFEHDGVDVDAILNSLAENLRKKKYESGASTISQQVVKNLFLTDEKSVVRKLKEFIVTERLERKLTKNQILELYLNLAEFGPEVFGVGEAAQAYFRKSPGEINAAEGAFIALMLPSPRKHYYSIFQNRNLAPTKRRKIRRVLGDMLANEYISPKQYHQYISYNFFKHAPK